MDQLKGIGGEHPIFQDGGLVLSIPDAISRVLEKRYLVGVLEEVSFVDLETGSVLCTIRPGHDDCAGR